MAMTLHLSIREQRTVVELRGSVGRNVAPTLQFFTRHIGRVGRQVQEGICASESELASSAAAALEDSLSLSPTPSL